jgi:hypothetical protein
MAALGLRLLRSNVRVGVLTAALSVAASGFAAGFGTVKMADQCFAGQHGCSDCGPGDRVPSHCPLGLLFRLFFGCAVAGEEEGGGEC